MVITSASNIRCGDNPAYTLDDFFGFYPQFKDIVPDVVVNSFLELANNSLQYRRYFGQWKFCMSLFIAHFLTLYLESVSDNDTPSADEVISSAAVRGIVTSESVSGVSYSQDVSTITNDLNGWAQWKLTKYGVQFASIAKLMGKGGVLVW